MAKAPPDGYTLGILSMPFVIAPSLVAQIPYDLERDFAPIGLVVWHYSILVVPAGSPAKSVPELVALAKAKPGALKFSSGGNGTPPHLAGELFNRAAGLEIAHIPYKGAPASVAALLSGDVDMMIAATGAASVHVKSGKLRALATSSPQRIAAYPALPTFLELGYGVEIRDWHGIVAPAGTPKDLIGRLHEEIAKVTATPETRQRFEALGMGRPVVAARTSSPRTCAPSWRAGLRWCATPGSRRTERRAGGGSGRGCDRRRPRSGREVAQVGEAMRLLNGGWAAQAISAAAELRHRGPAGTTAYERPGELARETGCHEPSLRRLLRALASLGLCEEREERFRSGPTALGAAAGRRRAAVVAGAGALRRVQAAGVGAARCTACRPANAPSPLVHGADVFEHLERDAATAGHLRPCDDRDHARDRPRGRRRRTTSRDFDRVVDVGGGNGELLAAILRASPATRGALLERPRALDGARRLLERAGVAERCELVAGDFFESVPGGADCYLLKRVLHDWDDDRAAAILRRCRQAMSAERQAARRRAGDAGPHGRVCRAPGGGADGPAHAAHGGWAGADRRRVPGAA